MNLLFLGANIGFSLEDGDVDCNEDSFGIVGAVDIQFVSFDSKHVATFGEMLT